MTEPSHYAGLASLYATLPFDAGVPATPNRLAGLPVLLIQGRTDRVIPAELQARSWSYLHDRSGAELTAHRTPAGHHLTDNDINLLAHWISGLRPSPS